jgi:hypothetical protein
MLLVATPGDRPLDWLRAGETMERLLLELTRHGWAASPVTQALEVPATRAELRSALTGELHPQVLVRVGHAAPTIAVPRRPRDEVVQGSRRRSVPMRRTPTAWPPAEKAGRPHGPVSDGRGGTIWL